MLEIGCLIVGLIAGLGLAQWVSLPNFSKKVKSTPDKTVSKAQPILIPVRHEQGYPAHAVQAGLEIARHSGQALHLIVFLEVPRVYTMESGLEAEIETAFDIIEQAEQASHAFGLRLIGNISKVRNYTQGVISTACEIKAGLIIEERFDTLRRPSLASQAEFIRNKTGCNIILLNNDRVE